MNPLDGIPGTRMIALPEATGIRSLHRPATRADWLRAQIRIAEDYRARLSDLDLDVPSPERRRRSR